MRKLVVLSFISIDGVMQAPGGPQEDTSGGFKFGGWIVPFFDDVLGKVMEKQLDRSYELLLGRKTYDIFAAYWPHQKNSSIGDKFNIVKKYVVSTKERKLDWFNSILIKDNVVEEIRKLKNQNGPELHVHGSGNLIQTLVKHDLVDELWLKIFPITLGEGKGLFAGGQIPARFKLIESTVSSNGVIAASYARDGDVQTGSF